MIKSDTERIKKIIDMYDRTVKYIQEYGIDKENLLENEFYQWALTTPLYNIGEQVYNLSNEFKEQHSQQPWSLVSGLRHRLVHDYEGINWTIIVDVIFDELPDFVAEIKTYV